MAIKLTTDSTVKTFRPYSGMFFTIDELNEEVGGWVDPFKVGPIWVITREKAQEAGLALNSIASYFFDVPLYGDVLVVSPQQLPEGWSLEDEFEKAYSADMIDSGFMLSLQNALLLKKVREENEGFAESSLDFFMDSMKMIPKEEYFYAPPENCEVDDNTVAFLEKVYSYITKSPVQFKNGVILDEDQVIVRARKGDLWRILEMMKGFYIENEEYEKCAVLQSLEQECK